MNRILLCLLAGSLALLAQPRKIVVSGMSAEAVKELQAAAPSARVVGVTPETLMQEVADADALLGTVNPEIVRTAKKLKWVQTYSAGVEPYLHRAKSQELRDSNILLTNCKIIQGPNIADHAFAMLLALTRNIPQILKWQAGEEWARGKQPYRAVELSGKTAVIIGVGGIGNQIAVRAAGFGMEVIGVDPKDIPYAAHLKKVIPPDQLDTVLPQADVVFIAAPHTPQSNNMMGARQFELLKKDAYFIAVSRGSIYDMNALVRALDSKRLAGAGVDVTNPEPLPKGHPLWKFDNAIITPHVAGQSDLVQPRRMELLKDNIQRFLDGRPMRNVVDKQRGY